MPCPRRRNTRPSCVPAGIVSASVRRSGGPRLPGSRPLATAEEGLEEVGERGLIAEEVAQVLVAGGAVLVAHAPRARIGEAAPLERLGPCAGCLLGALPLLVLPPARAELVVALALLGVAEHLVGLVELLEALLGLAIAGIDVGVVAARQLAEGRSDLLLRG